MKQISVIIVLVFTAQLVFGQFPEKQMMKKLNADKIEMDKGNGDGVFKARNRKTKKWGMYQWMYEGVKTKELIPMEYDSLKYFPFNGAFTAVYNNGKVGFYLSAWSYDDAKQTVECLYDDYQRYNINNTTYLAVKKNGKWGWVDWLSGEEKSEFIYDDKSDLPKPKYVQAYY
jgi:hypothetical protein